MDSITVAMAEQNLDPTDPIYQVSAGYTKAGFPAPGLPRTQRYITGHNAEGKGVFLSTDSGGHFRPMGADQAIATILYSTHQTPVNLNDDADVKYAKDNEVRAKPLSARPRPGERGQHCKRPRGK